MKKFILSALVLLVSLAAMGQDYPDNYEQGRKPSGDKVKYKTERQKGSVCSRVYFDLSTGINNNGGLLGIGADVHVSGDFSVNAGLGILTTWGYKLYAGGKYFFKPCHKGWAIGGGFTYNTGIPEFKSDQETIYGTTEQVTVKLAPQVNALVAAYKYWSVGKKSNRVFLQLGFSAALTQDKYTQLSGSPISKNSDRALRIVSPGGIIVGAGFSFGK
jgi:hypothetical protein